MNVEFNYEVIDIDPLFPRVWTVLNFKVLTFTVQRSASGVQRPKVQSSEPSIQGPASRVQRPEFTVQSPASNSCVQSPGIPVCYYNTLFYEININFLMKNINEVILLLGKLSNTQTEIMTRDAQSFNRSNEIKSFRLPVPRFHKLGWQETHTFHKKLLKNSAAPIIITGDPIATGLKRYQHIWKNYFKDALNLGISGDRVENVSQKARDISLCHTTCL